MLRSFAFLSLSAGLCCAQTAASASARLERVRRDPPALYQFLLHMPKGADLHNHLSGAVYAESLLNYAVESSLCVDTASWSFVAADVCTAQKDVEAAKVQESAALSSRLIDALSMRDFVPGRESGHDHFFATFDKFGLASHGHDDESLAEVVRRAAGQNESYLELMALSAGSEISEMGDRAGLDASKFDTARQKLLADGLERQISALKSHVDALEAGRIKLLGCDERPDSAPCQVIVRYVFQVMRNSTPGQVFAQMLAGFLLAQSDSRVVAVNFVQAEDGFRSMRDYHLQMQMVAFARAQYPAVHVSLHAGELAPGLVPPEGLRFHIAEAVNLAHAERIGHGVDIAYETDSAGTLRAMRDRHIDVEINLTSNDGILGVRGKDHPFELYRKSGVPVTLSTDDEGVSRTHLTEEFERAVETYGLSYGDLKTMVRNSLEYSFLPGTDKARLEADLERRFAAFEKTQSLQ